MNRVHTLPNLATGQPVTPVSDVEWLETERRRVENAIAAHFHQLGDRDFSHSDLGAAVRYSMVDGGKRVRPILVVECCRTCGGDPAEAIDAAIAIECVHAFSLIHDDLPAMDDDDLRRGRPTNHKVFGEALAILAGDWLLSHAYRLLVERRHGAALARILARGTGEMIAGQAADIAGEAKPTDRRLVEYIHRHKTAGLIRAACELGAICGDANAERLAALGRFGEHLGLAFQIVDDLLDRTGTAESLGKRAGKDAATSKQTYPDALGADESRVAARQQVEHAIGALTTFGEAADRLRGLARFVLARDH